MRIGRDYLINRQQVKAQAEVRACERSYRSGRRPRSSLALGQALAGLSLLLFLTFGAPFAANAQSASPVLHANEELAPAGRPDRRYGLAESTRLIPNAIVAQMIDNIQATGVSNHVSSLTGVTPVIVGGANFTLTSRSTTNTTQIGNATQYVYEFMQARGLSVSYYNWTDTQQHLSGRNVIGSMTGKVRPGEIVLITAHLDDMPESGSAPGADDNASGSTGVLMAAAGMAGHDFERTVRFILFTGEEQGFLGSKAYANACAAASENIVAVFNMDMLGWDGNDDGRVTLHTRRTSDVTGYALDSAIAGVFTQVISDYGISLTTRIYNDRPTDVDNISFWNVGYPGVLAIEDDMTQWNPYYHTSADTLATLNLPYLTSFIKASAGTAAHLAIPLTQARIYLPFIQK